MKNVLSILLITLVATVFAACPAATETGSNTNTNGTGTETAKTTEDILAELDKSAGEAWMKKDGKFFEGFLTETFVGNGSMGRSDRAMVVKRISGMDCEVKSTTTSDAKVTEISDGLALYTGKSTSEGTCDGKDIPDSYFATLYVKDGDTWKGAYYQSSDIPAAADAPKPEAEDKPDAAEPKKEEKPEAEAAEKKEEAPLSKMDWHPILSKSMNKDSPTAQLRSRESVSTNAR